MDIKAMQGKIVGFLKKYRYAALVLVIGIALMMIPSPTEKSEENTTAAVPSETQLKPALEEQLAAILSQIEGAGKVEVMLTIGTGEETVYQFDENTSVSDTTNAVQKSTVTVTDSQRNQTGLVRQINPPAYLGAIVVCQGADDPVIQLAIVDAVSKVTGLGANRISVLKMK